MPPPEEPDWFVPDSWYTAEADMYFTMSGGDPEMLNDSALKLLFDVAYFESGITPQEREDARLALRDYLVEEYDVNFDSAMDWQDYREWYDNAA